MLGARALTVGHDVLFGKGEYAPSSRSGWTLLAHELTHAAEAHSPVMPGAPLSMGGAGDRAEHVADVASSAAFGGRSAGVTVGATAPGTVRAKRKDEPEAPQNEAHVEKVHDEAQEHLTNLFPNITTDTARKKRREHGEGIADMPALVTAFQEQRLAATGRELPGELVGATKAAILKSATEHGALDSAHQIAALGKDGAAKAEQWYARPGRKEQLAPMIPQIAQALGLKNKTEMDAELLQAIADFQQKHSPDGKIGVDGIVGPKTLALLQSKAGLKAPAKAADPSGVGGLDAKNVWPKKGLKEPAQYDHWAKLLAKSGQKVDATNPDRPIVIGLRGLQQGAGKTHRTKAKRAYDDTFVMIWKDGDKKRVFMFKGATHPYQKGPNKYGGVAMIKGDMTYDVSTIGNGNYYGYRAPLVKHGKSANVPSYRQKDYDGYYAGKGETRQTTADAILFHPGYDTKRRTKPSKFSSIGCQTASGKDIERMTAIAFDKKERKKGGRKGFDYVLLNGATAVKAADAAADSEKQPKLEGTVRRHGRGGDLDVASALPQAERLMRQSTPSGRPGPDAVQAMQESMGAHVGGVHLHTDSSAAQAADVLNADAFSVGNRVYFGAGRYERGTKAPERLELLFHELAHTTQSAGGGTGAAGTGLKLGAASSVMEQAADHAARVATTSMRQGPVRAPATRGAVHTGGTTIRRKERDPKAAAKAPTHSEKMTEKVLGAVTMTETNGKAVESRLDTSAGVKASYKSKVQATAIWSVDHIGRHPSIMKQFGLTQKDMQAGTKRLKAARRVYDTIMRSGVQKPADFAEKQKKKMEIAGLTQADVKKMMAMRDFKYAVRNPSTASVRHAASLSPEQLWAHASEAEKKRYKSAAELAKAPGSMKRLRSSVAARLKKTIHVTLGHQAGLDDVSLNTYRKRALAGRPIWGEDRAAWERVALNRGGDGVGQKVQQATEHDGGMTLGRAVIGQHVARLLKSNPKATPRQLITYVASKHNPWAGSPYIDKTWAHYKKLYGK